MEGRKDGRKEGMLVCVTCPVDTDSPKRIFYWVARETGASVRDAPTVTVAALCIVEKHWVAGVVGQHKG
jgi:hypothetical protein